MTNNTPRIPDSIDMQRLSAMQLVAKMKESADKHGVGFVGGFIAPNGEKFMMSNMSDEDTQFLLPDDLKWNQSVSDNLPNLNEQHGLQQIKWTTLMSTTY